MNDVVIKVKHLSKVYKLYNKKSDRLREALSPTKRQYSKEFYALNDISFDVKRGETVGIIGTNGSGKSTLLKILTGVVAPSSGSYTVNGKVSALLELGAGFNSEYTGLQNIDLQGVMMGYTEEEMRSRRDEIIRFADIGEYINQPVKNYSSGMFARLAFAVAISIEPEILIVDEALSVGDVFFQSKCFRKFDELKEKGVSIIFVSHDTASVRKMCTRVLWIEQGEQRLFGSSNKVCTAYFNHQTQRMNEQNRQYIDYLNNAQETGFEIEDATLVVPEIHASADSMLSEKVEILSAYIKDKNGNYVNHIVADKMYTVGIITKFFSAMDDIIIGFTLTNKKGSILLGENTYASENMSLHVDEDMILETTFSFIAPRFRTEEYEISPAVAQGVQLQHVNLTWLHGVLSVSWEREGYELSEVGLECRVVNRQIKDLIIK